MLKNLHKATKNSPVGLMFSLVLIAATAFGIAAAAILINFGPVAGLAALGVPALVRIAYAMWSGV